MVSLVDGLNHHGITVSSIERSLDFFVGVLGLEPGPTVELDEAFVKGVTGVIGTRVRVTFVHGPGFDLELLQYLEMREPRAGRAAASDAGSAHLALFVSDIDAIVGASAGVGWTLAGSVQDIVVGPRAGGRAAYLRDTDGSLVEIVQRPSSSVEKRK